MIVRTLKDIEGTDRDVTAETGTWRSKRIILADDRVGFSLHETVMYAGTETSMWYANHVEAVLCVEGEGELTDDETGERHRISPARSTCSTATNGTPCAPRPTCASSASSTRPSPGARCTTRTASTPCSPRERDQR